MKLDADGARRAPHLTSVSAREDATRLEKAPGRRMQLIELANLSSCGKLYSRMPTTVACSCIVHSVVRTATFRICTPDQGISAGWICTVSGACELCVWWGALTCILVTRPR